MIDLLGWAVISEKAEEIERGAFCDNKNVKAVTVPSNVRRIGEAVFRGCTT